MMKLKQRLISWILVLAVVIGTIPMNVLAATDYEVEEIITETEIIAETDNTAPQIVGTDISVTMRLNEWEDIDLSQYFSDLEGDEMTYQVSYDGESWTEASEQFAYYPTGDGEQKAYFRAVDAANNESGILALTADVEEAPSEVTVELSIKQGPNKFYTAEETGKIMVPTEITVPYFDLGLYDLKEYYYNPQCYSTHKEGDSEHENSQLVGTKETAEGVVTLMHVFIYATERYYLGYDESEAGTGASYESGEIQEAISWTGGVGSSFMNLWDHGTNLNYYVDWAYPVGAHEWGSTSDQIALYGGEEIVVHMIESTQAHGADFTFFTLDGNYARDSKADKVTAVQGDQVELTSVLSVPDYDKFTTNYTANVNKKVYYARKDELNGDIKEADIWKTTEALCTDAQGKVVLDTTGMEPGEYYVVSEGAYDADNGTECGAAVIELTLEKGLQHVELRLVQWHNDKKYEVFPEETGLVYDNTYVYFAELPYFEEYSIWDDCKVTGGRIWTDPDVVSGVSTSDYIEANLKSSIFTKSAVEEKYGEIVNLDSEDTLIQVFDVHNFLMEANDTHGFGELMYTLIVEVPITRVSGVTLNKTELTLEGGEYEKLTATVSPTDASYPKVTWTSSDTDVVEVEEDGSIYTYKAGQAIITATADGVSATCEVTVNSDCPKPTMFYSGGNWPMDWGRVTGMTINGQPVKMYKWVDDHCYIILDDNSEYSAIASQNPRKGYLRFWQASEFDVFVNDVKVADSKSEFVLVDGKAELVIGTSVNNFKKTIHISEDYFDIVPFLTDESTTTYNMLENDVYTVDVTALFTDVSGHGATFKVSVDGAEAVPVEDVYRCEGLEIGKHTLVFTANNTIGDSPTYTVNLGVFSEESICRVDKEGEHGSFDWVAFTDTNLQPFKGMSVQFDDKTNTFNVALPDTCLMYGNVMVAYKLTQNEEELPFITGSTMTSGVGSLQWHGQIRTEQTESLNYGEKSFEVYYYDNRPSGWKDNKYITYHFNIVKQRPTSSFEYIVAQEMPETLSQIAVYGDVGSVNGHSWYQPAELHVALGMDTPDDAVIATNGKGDNLSGNGEISLKEGYGKVSLKQYVDFKYYTTTVLYQKDNLPVLANDAETGTIVEMACLDTYELDLAPIFTDIDEKDILTYQVKVDDGEWTNVENPDYSFIPQSAKEYSLVFRAFDGFIYSEDTYTVTITATNAKETYDVTVNHLPDGAEFYCFAAKDKDGAASLGDKLSAEYKSQDGSYLLKVPVNVTRIVIVCDGDRVTAEVSKENGTNTINMAKIILDIQTAAGNPAEGTVEIMYGDGHKVINDDLETYLVVGESYTYTAFTNEVFAENWIDTTLENQKVTKDDTVVIQFGVRSPKTITIDQEAELTVFYQSRYYVMNQVEPAVVKDNGDGTITYTFSCPSKNTHSMGYMYFATNGDWIDKAGYLMGTDATTVTWKNEERKNDYRAPYDVNYGQGNRGDDSVLVNINSQNHLILNEGDTFRLRSFRIWEIINTDTENVMIEPQYIYSGYDENIISMVSANEALTAQECGTGGNNWMDMTVQGKGITFLEVGYEAIHLVNGYAQGAWGGADSAADNDIFNASDPARNALIVIQTDGKAATDVSFGIECFSSNVDGEYYDKKCAVAWDAEFDTVYFLDNHGEITLSPSAKNGSISSVEISADKGNTWSSLTADDNGTYVANIYSGNNVIRVTKDDGTTAYQVVRGDKISYEQSLVNDLNNNGYVNPGDTVRVTLHGLHNPVGKMSGVYNPGFSHGQRVTYTWNGINTRQSGYFQYNFVSNAWIEVTIPEDADGAYSLTDGYICFNVFGDMPGNHRNLKDGGREINMSAASSNYTRCLLPDILVYESTPLGDVNNDGEMDSVDANMVLSYYYGYKELTAAEIKKADVNRDGEVDSVDANMILSYYYGYIDELE